MDVGDIRWRRQPWDHALYPTGYPYQEYLLSLPEPLPLVLLLLRLKGEVLPVLVAQIQPLCGATSQTSCIGRKGSFMSTDVREPSGDRPSDVHRG
jgi:hypothetical protein